MTALVGVVMEYSILLGQTFSTDFVVSMVQLQLENKSAYHSMCQLQRTGLQGANNPQWLPHNDILDIFAPDLGLEAISHVGIGQTLDALWQ